MIPRQFLNTGFVAISYLFGFSSDVAGKPRPPSPVP
jgi:hypothetical protein